MERETETIPPHFLIPFPFSRFFVRCFAKLERWKDYYFENCRNVKFISGLSITHRFLNYAVVGVLITYLTESFAEHPLVDAAILTNLGEGLSELTLIYLTATSSSHASYQKVIVMTSVSYTMGLYMLCVDAYGLRSGNEVFYYLYRVVVVITINVGAAGSKPILDNFFKAQLWFHENRGPEIMYHRLNARFVVWRVVMWVLALVPILLTSPLAWRVLFLVSGPLLAASCFWFIGGASSYHTIRSVMNPLSVVSRVVRAAISKRNAEYPNSSDDFFQSSFVSSCPDRFFHKENENEVHLLPRVRFCRWMDKAAIKELAPEEHEKKCRTVTRVYEAKHVLALVPMWVAFLGFGVARAICNTFYVLQAETISKNSKTSGPDINVQTLLIIKTIAEESISSLWDLVLGMLTSTIKRRYCFLKCRIVLGIISSLTGLVVACMVGFEEPKTVWLLVPQFCLSGLAEGLALNGLAEFYNYRVPESMRGYGDALNGLLKGLGSLLSIPCLCIFRTTMSAGEDLDSFDLASYYNYINIPNLVTWVTVCSVILPFGYYTYSDIAEKGCLDETEFFMKDVSEQERLYHGRTVDPFGFDPEERDREEPRPPHSE